MSDVQIFKFAGAQDIRTVVIDGEPWFVASDVCRVLGLSNVTMALSRANGADISSTEVWSEANNRGYATKVVNESGLYDLVLSSRKPEAKAFRRWITSEVLPALRQTGKYDMYDPSNATDLLRQAEPIMQAMSRKIKELEPKAEVQTAIYAKKGGYTRSHLHAIVMHELGYTGTLVEFNQQLSRFGVTAQVGGKFYMTEDFKHWSDDPTYHNYRLGTDMPSNNPHFNEDGRAGVLGLFAGELVSPEKLTRN